MNCIVNVTENWGIGRENQLIAPISADLKRFRRLTSGKVVILGRKTLATFPGGAPLKNRVNLVLSSDRALIINGATVAHNLQELFEQCRQYPEDDLWVIGGASIYELLLPYCKAAQITRTFSRPQADRFFPDLDALENWSVTHASKQMEEDGISFQYLDYVNSSPRSYR